MATTESLDIQVNKYILDLFKYWRKRCELAEKYILECPCDPDITSEQIKAYNEWVDYKGDCKVKEL